MNLINRLNEFFAFDHNIFFLDSNTSSNIVKNRSILAGIVPKSVYNFDHHRVDNSNGTEMTTFDDVMGKNTLLIVITECIEFKNNSELLAEMKKIRYSKVTVKIGVILKRSVTSTYVIERFFRWSWSAGIVNIFVAFYSNIEEAEMTFNVFRFDPFGTFELINVTDCESVESNFPDEIPNYREQPFRMKAFIGEPAFFQDFMFWDTVVRVFNASISIIDLNFDNMTVDSEPTDIWINDFITASFNVVYPHRVVALILFVPHAQPYSNIVAYLQNATWTLLFAYAFLVIAAGSVVLTISDYLQTNKMLLLHNVIDVINILMNDNGAIRYGRLRRAEIFVIVPLTFTGLIVSNGILSVFQSYLAVPIFEPQINTIEDLFKSSIPIVTYIDEENMVDFLEHHSQHGGWSNRVHGIEFSNLWKEGKSFNNSIAFLVYDDVHVILDVQSRLNIKAFHLITETQWSKMMFSYCPDRVFPFIKAIDDLIHRLQSAGLMAKWIRDKYELSMKDTLKINLNRQHKTKNESESEQLFVPAIIWCGWIASAIYFCCEIIWKKMELLIEDLKKKLIDLYMWQHL